MTLTELYLHDFRNYRDSRVCFSPGVNMLLGENAQGKTNLLEAVSLLSGRKSFRAQRERDLIFQGAPASILEAQVDTDRRLETLRIEWSAAGQRRLYRNGVRKTRLAEFSQVLRTVLFLPEDLRIIEDGASARRRFLDGALSQLSPRYIRLLREYGRVLEQKNKILRDYAGEESYLALLPDYNRQLSFFGAGLIGLRARLIRRLDQLVAELGGRISGGRDLLALGYETVSCVEDPFLPESELAAQLEEHLKLRLPAELAAGTCLSGPHRDDLTVTIDGQPARYFGSKGQVRTAAISLKLAERQIHRETFGAYPLLLLDDVLSELDDVRRDFVVNQIEQGQVLLTCCRQEQVRSGRIYWIQGGQIASSLKKEETPDVSAFRAGPADPVNGSAGNL